MNYTKPEVILNADAIVAIQSATSKQAIELDADNVQPVSTSAYEADE
jgi:hypothetical protein